MNRPAPVEVQAVHAYQQLTRLAETGNPVTGYEMWQLPNDDPRLIQDVGSARTFFVEVELPNVEPEQVPYPGMVQLRLAHVALGSKYRNTLGLRTRMEWQAGEDRHFSGAVYHVQYWHLLRLCEGDLDLAVMAAGLPEEPEHEALRLERYGAVWTQRYPGREQTDPDTAQSPSAEEWGLFHQADAHHSRAIAAAKKAHPDLLCMLTDSNFGDPNVNHLIRLARWALGQS